MEFKDHFSAQAFEYSKYRPKYPEELFQYLSSLTNEHELAWDCACGNGQASVSLADYYQKIIATDASSTQIEHAISHPKITYKIVTAENSGLKTHSADLITVATAIHWIDTDKFYPEVRRILKPGGIIAVWNYTDTNITPEIDKLMNYFTHTLLKDDWPPENQKMWNFEESVDFPFERIKNPKFYLEAVWSMQDYMNFLYTWSAVQKHIKTHNVNPVDLIKEELKKLWGDENEQKKVSSDLKIKIARV